MEFENSPGDFRVVNGVRYVFKDDNLPAPLYRRYWDGGPVGGEIEERNGDFKPFGASNGNGVCWFPDFISAVVYAQRRARRRYNEAVKFAAAYAEAFPGDLNAGA